VADVSSAFSLHRGKACPPWRVRRRHCGLAAVNAERSTPRRAV